MGAAVEISKLLMQEALPKKKLFTGPEIASLLNISSDQIFMWESEFPQIRLRKSVRGPRLYDRDDVLLFSAIKQLLKEKNLTIPLALKALAETDTRGDQMLGAYFLVEDNPDSIAPVVMNESTQSGYEGIHSQKSHVEEELLWDSSRLLPEEENGFDETIQEIYQECSEAMEEASVLVEPNNVGEMLADALVLEQRRQLQAYKIEEYTRTYSLLMQRRQSLYELLGALEKYEPSSLFFSLKL